MIKRKESGITIVAILSLLSLTVGQLSCKKKDTGQVAPVSLPTVTAAPIQTIYPSKYLPAYPGSYWIYKSSGADTGTITITTGPSYIHDSVNTVSFMNPSYQHAMVPVYNGSNLWGVNTHYYNHSGNNGLLWVPYLEDSAAVKGHKWILPYSYGSGHTVTNYYTTLCSDTSLVVSGTTYNHVIATRAYTDIGYGIMLVGDKYYAKNVGLIASYGYNGKIVRTMNPVGYMPPDSVVYSMELSSYFINK